MTFAILENKSTCLGSIFTIKNHVAFVCHLHLECKNYNTYSSHEENILSV